MIIQAEGYEIDTSKIYMIDPIKTSEMLDKQSLDYYTRIGIYSTYINFIAYFTINFLEERKKRFTLDLDRIIDKNYESFKCDKKGYYEYMFQVNKVNTMLSKFRSEIVKYWKEDQSTIPQVFILESPEKNIIL